MSTFHRGEIVDITIKGARVREYREIPDDAPELTVAVECQAGGEFIRLPHGWPMITVEQRAPAEWPPRPGDLWRGGDGDVWFARRYCADPDDNADWEGCNNEGWRTVLTPLDGGPYGSSSQRPDEVNQKHGPMTLVHREEAKTVFCAGSECGHHKQLHHGNQCIGGSEDDPCLCTHFRDGGVER